MELFKILGLCITALFLSVILSQYKKEYALVISIFTGCFIFASVVREIVQPLQNLAEKLRATGTNSKYFSVAFKVLAIGYLTQFAADTCRDFGESALSHKAELAGKVAVFLLCVPLVGEIFDMITVLVGAK